MRIALVDGDLVLFDIDQDDYLAVACDMAVETVNALAGRSYRTDDPVVTELLNLQLIMPRSALWEPDVCRPVADLPRPRWLRPRLRAIVLFVRAALGTYIALRRQDAQWATVPAVRGRASDPTPDELAAIVAQFESWRILVPGTGRCLVQSMMLIRFLAFLQIKAEWVFGVRTHPFEAHCWVEREMFILNDAADHARWFTVIARF